VKKITKITPELTPWGLKFVLLVKFKKHIFPKIIYFVWFLDNFGRFLGQFWSFFVQFWSFWTILIVFVQFWSFWTFFVQFWYFLQNFLVALIAAARVDGTESRREFGQPWPCRIKSPSQSIQPTQSGGSRRIIR
jgi:hypothetical protein